MTLIFLLIIIAFLIVLIDLLSNKNKSYLEKKL